MQSLPQGSAVSIESLLAHADWVRALARQLVSDPASADDVEQEVWRAAIENPPRDGSNPRGWLASVARNAARTLGRANSRREAREQRNARAEALPATSELVAEAELARELAGEVLALEEPYRTVLLLRFWRALSPDEIAHAQSISRETVRTQLKRGLERLRERLDRRFGDREKWLAAIAPLATRIARLTRGYREAWRREACSRCCSSSASRRRWLQLLVGLAHAPDHAGDPVGNSKRRRIAPVETDRARRVAHSPRGNRLVRGGRASGSRAQGEPRRTEGPRARGAGSSMSKADPSPASSWSGTAARSASGRTGRVTASTLKRGVFTMPTRYARAAPPESAAAGADFLKEYGEPGCPRGHSRHARSRALARTRRRRRVRHRARPGDVGRPSAPDRGADDRRAHAATRGKRSGRCSSRRVRTAQAGRRCRRTTRSRMRVSSSRVDFSSLDALPRTGAKA